jgi:hypothetical protein
MQRYLEFLKDPLIFSIVAALVSSSVSYFVEHNFRRSKLAAVLLVLFGAAVATIVSFYMFANPTAYNEWTLSLTVVADIAVWAVLFHVTSIYFGPDLSHWLSSNWVRAIDYVYLTLSTLSIVRIVFTARASGSESITFNALAVVGLAFAVGLRITRTSIEIFGWDKPSQDRAR